MRWWGRRAYWVLALAPASAFIWAITQTTVVTHGNGPTASYQWVPQLHLTWEFQLDTLSWLMVILVGGIGALVLVYSSRYFAKDAQGLGRFGGILTAFAGAMLGLVLADNLLVAYIFWELTTVFSYLLIGHYSDRKASRRAAMQAIIVTTSGGLAMLVGFIMLGEQAGTYTISQLIASPPHGTITTIAITFVLLGALSKAALIPFHFWLPAAMAAPTPVSAYLHAAAMVKAGVYLIARFAPGFATETAWRAIVLTAGAATLLLGGYRALRQVDLKLVLAYGTVSQLGLIVLLVGAGTEQAALAGLAMLGAHAMFKAALFLVVGVVDVATGTRDLTELSGVGRKIPITATAGALAIASMIALPPLAGYVAKEAALTALLDGGAELGPPTWVTPTITTAVVLGSILTCAYGLRWWWGAFCTKPDAVPSRVARPARLLVAPALALALAGLAAGLVPSLGQRLLTPYAATYPAGEPGHLTLWPGLTPALGLSVLILAAGAGAFAVRGAIGRFQHRVGVFPEVDRVYRRSMRLLDRVAGRVTAATQRGSLPFYLGTILIVVVGAATWTLISAHRGPAHVRLWDSPIQAVVGVFVVAGAILCVRSRRRIKAIVMLGVTGYGTALLFGLYGAPDLALTQVLVETVVLVIAVLVLRRLPPYFSDRPLPNSRWVRLAVAVAVGVTVMALALIIPGGRIHPPVSEYFAEEAVTFGGGQNIVNVTLVDIRAWDTMGEISVLLVAATGVASLVFRSRRSGKIWRAREVNTSQWAARAAAARGSRGGTWLAAGATLSPDRRSVILEVITRLMFPTMVLFSFFLLFSGHNSPGGGFAAGLMVGIALIMRYLAGGRYELGEAVPISPGILLGAGLFLSAGVGLVSLALGVAPLQSTVVDLHLPLIGTMHLVTSLFFDIGVYLVVVGLMLDILRTLGAQIDRQGELAGIVPPDIAHDSRQVLPAEFTQTTGASGQDVRRPPGPAVPPRSQEVSQP